MSNSKKLSVVILSDGADELFGSYLTHRAAQPMYHFNRLYQRIGSSKLTKEENELFAPCSRVFLEELFAKSDGDEDRWRYHLYLFTDEEKDILLTENFRRKTERARSFNLIQQYFKEVTSKDPLNRILEIEWNTQLPDQVLAFIDFLSMAHSIEIRSPFLDYRLLEFVATIPGAMKIRDGNVKDILKKTVESLLPEGITKRPKEGFVLPIFNWMMEELKDYSMSVLSESRLRKHNFIDPAEAKNILESYHSGNHNKAARVWNLMMFQLWWENYFG